MTSSVYRSTLPISTLKKQDLQKLCQENVIPKKYQQEFLNLTANNSRKDELPETDQEDEIDTAA